MSVDFNLPERPFGIALHSAGPGEFAYIQAAQIALATDPFLVQQRLGELQDSVFRHIPDFDPTRVGHALVVIRRDLSATAYVNELRTTAQARVTRSVSKGAPVRKGDVSEIIEVDLGMEVPEDVGVVHYMTAGWKRTVYFDYMPLLPEPRPRIGPFSAIGAQQLMSLWGLSPDLQQSLPRTEGAAVRMSDAFQLLRSLVSSNSTKEAQLQKLLQEHPWVLGGHYKAVERHVAMDDKNIPDFTAVRGSDDCRDIVELKLPQAKCSNQDNSLSAEFNRHWDQAERYVDFATRNRDYLLHEKGLAFDNPKAWLIIGNNLDAEVLGQIRRKERMNPRITVMPYDRLLAQAGRVLGFVRAVTLGEIDMPG